MNLRPYQGRAVDAVQQALREHASTLLVAPTGAGKTIMLAHAARQHADSLGRPASVLVIQHRGELVTQNRAAFERINRGWATAAYTADVKTFARPNGYLGAATFAMVPSLGAAALRALPAIDLVIADEAHHAPARTWRAVFDAARERNPDVKLLGVTATPARGDGKALGQVFATVAEQIQIGELIEGGFLVRPRALVAEVGLADQIRALPRTANGRGEFDMGAVARLVDHEPITQAIIAQWRAHAGERQTVVFCATVAHAQHVCDAFRRAGVAAGVVTGEDATDDRATTIRAFDRRELRVIVNVMTLTEGWDSPAASCVMLLRPSAFRSLVVQMIGRGLRLAPGKSDCLILDFGASLESMGGLDQVLELGGARRVREPGPPPMKPCGDPKCRRPIPLHARECPLCGYQFPPRVSEAPPLLDPSTIRLRPFDVVLRESPWVWVDVGRPPAADRAKIACSDRVWAVAFADRAGAWHAFGSAPRTVETDVGEVVEDATPAHLGSGTLSAALSAADAFLSARGSAREHGRGAAAYHRLPATEKQIAFARRLGIDLPARPTLYRTACAITARLARDTIRRLLPAVQSAGAALPHIHPVQPLRGVA